MRSIKVRYVTVREIYPEQYSSYLCFAYAVRGQKFSYEMVSKYFNLLVEKDDYARSERNDIVKYLHYLSMCAEEKEFRAKNRSQGP